MSARVVSTSAVDVDDLGSHFVFAAARGGALAADLDLLPHAVPRERGWVAPAIPLVAFLAVAVTDVAFTVPLLDFVPCTITVSPGCTSPTLLTAVRETFEFEVVLTRTVVLRLPGDAELHALGETLFQLRFKSVVVAVTKRGRHGEAIADRSAEGAVSRRKYDALRLSIDRRVRSADVHGRIRIPQDHLVGLVVAQIAKFQGHLSG